MGDGLAQLLSIFHMLTQIQLREPNVRYSDTLPIFRYTSVFDIGGADRGDIDMEIDSVQQRPGDLGLIISGASRRA